MRGVISVGLLGSITIFINNEERKKQMFTRLQSNLSNIYLTIVCYKPGTREEKRELLAHPPARG